MDELRDLGLFVAVAEQRSFTKAAAILAIPTSTLSRRIAQLEASLGLKLFNRNTRTVALTEAGLLLLQRSRSIVEEARNARDEVSARLASPQGLIRISIEAETGPRLAGPVIAEYVRRYPAVRIELDVSPRRVDLVADGFDLALRIGQLPDSSVTVRRLALLRAHLYASPAYLGEHGAPPTPADLPGHRRIHLLHKEDNGAWHLTDGDERFEVANDSALSTNSMAMARQFALAGLGIAVLDDFLVADDVASGRLVRLLPAWSLRRYPISAMIPGRLIPAKVRLLIDMLARQAAITPGLDRP